MGWKTLCNLAGGSSGLFLSHTAGILWDGRGGTGVVGWVMSFDQEVGTI